MSLKTSSGDDKAGICDVVVPLLAVRVVCCLHRHASDKSLPTAPPLAGNAVSNYEQLATIAICLM